MGRDETGQREQEEWGGREEPCSKMSNVEHRISNIRLAFDTGDGIR